MNPYVHAQCIAPCLPFLAAAANTACGVLRQEQVDRNKRLKEHGDDIIPATADLAMWSEQSSFNRHFVDAALLTNRFTYTKDGRDYLVYGDMRIGLSRDLVAQDWQENAQLGLALLPAGGPPPSWVLRFAPREVDRIHVPACKRLIGDGWAAPDALPHPEIAPTVPAYLVDYMNEIVLFDAHRPDIRLPVFSRAVVLGEVGRMRNCLTPQGLPATGV